MSAAAAATASTKKQLKREFFNAIKGNDVSGVTTLIPRLHAAGLDIDTHLGAYHPATLDIIKPRYPVSIAVFYKANDVLRVLIDKGARKNNVEQFYIVYNEGENYEYHRLDKDKVFTPLRYAVYFRNDTAARILLEAGAKYPDAEDYANNNNNYNNYNNNNNPVGYEGLLAELFEKITSGVSFVNTFTFIVQHRGDLDLHKDDIYDDVLRQLGRIPNPLPYFTIIFEEFYESAELAANRELTHEDSKLYAYEQLLNHIQSMRAPLPLLTYVFTHGIDPNAQNREGETVLFSFTRGLERTETASSRAAIIKGLIELGVNPYLANGAGETAAVRAIKRGLPKEVIDALNPRSLDMIHELREVNPYIVERIATKFTKKHLRNTPKSYAKLLSRALENNDARNDARIAFRPANIPNIHGRTGKNYTRMKANQRRRAAETQRPTTGGRHQRSVASRKRQQRQRLVNLKRIRRRTLKATKPQ